MALETVEDVLVELLGERGNKKGSPKKKWHIMTATRYGHAADLLKEGVYYKLVNDAVDRINASSWLKKSAFEITDEDIEQLFVDKPWERYGTNEAVQESPEGNGPGGQQRLFGGGEAEERER